MATALNKPIRREVSIEGQAWIVSVVPADPGNRVPRIEFRMKHTRSVAWIPIEAARNAAARRSAGAQARVAARRRARR